MAQLFCCPDAQLYKNGFGIFRIRKRLKRNEYQISTELSGKVAAVNFEEGDTVKSGDILFTLDSDLLEAQLNENLAAQSAAQANLDAAQAT